MKLLILVVCVLAFVQRSMQISWDIPEILKNIDQVPEPNRNILGFYAKNGYGTDKPLDGDEESIGDGVIEVDSEKVPEDLDDGKDLKHHTRTPKMLINHHRTTAALKSEHEDGDGSENVELPLLIKTLRLRLGSDEYNRIVEKFINDQKEQLAGGDGNDGKPEISDKEDELIHAWIDKFMKDKKKRHGDPDKDDNSDGRNKRSSGDVPESSNKLPPPPPEDAGELPLLIKTLRLRPGSDEYNRIVEKFINDRKEQQQGGDDGKIE